MWKLAVNMSKRRHVEEYSQDVRCVIRSDEAATLQCPVSDVILRATAAGKFEANNRNWG